MIRRPASASATTSPSCTSPAGAARAALGRLQAVDIETSQTGDQDGHHGCAKPSEVPRAFQQSVSPDALRPAGAVLIDMPFDVQMAEIEFDIGTTAAGVLKPAATRKQVEKALDMLAAADRHSSWPGGGVVMPMRPACWWNLPG